MTKWMLVVAACVATMAAACGSDDEKSSPGVRPTDAGTTEAKLSVAFSDQCSRCHGDEGLGSSVYPKIPGSKDEAAFIAIVRAGRGEMPAFKPSEISDAELKADYLYLTRRK